MGTKLTPDRSTDVYVVVGNRSYLVQEMPVRPGCPALMFDREHGVLWVSSVATHQTFKAGVAALLDEVKPSSGRLTA